MVNEPSGFEPQKFYCNNNKSKGHNFAGIWWTVTSGSKQAQKFRRWPPSWENREKFAESWEKWFRTEGGREKHGYTISSYENLADLFFLCFNIWPNNNSIWPNRNKTKINNNNKNKRIKKTKIIIIKKKSFYTDFVFVLQGRQFRKVLKSKNNYIYKFWY